MFLCVHLNSTSCKTLAEGLSLIYTYTCLFYSPCKRAVNYSLQPTTQLMRLQAYPSRPSLVPKDKASVTKRQMHINQSLSCKSIRPASNRASSVGSWCVWVSCPHIDTDGIKSRLVHNNSTLCEHFMTLEKQALETFWEQKEKLHINTDKERVEINCKKWRFSFWMANSLFFLVKNVRLIALK